MKKAKAGMKEKEIERIKWKNDGETEIKGEEKVVHHQEFVSNSINL